MTLDGLCFSLESRVEISSVLALKRAADGRFKPFKLGSGIAPATAEVLGQLEKGPVGPKKSPAGRLMTGVPNQGITAQCFAIATIC